MTACIVPFCKRTQKRFDGEWICGDHWPAVPLRLKRLLSHYKRKRDRAGWETVWRWCKAAAIEIAAGIRK